MSDQEDLPSPSETFDTDSLPEGSVSDPPGTPQAWLSDLDPDGARWIDARDEAALGIWGSPTAVHHPTPFNPATAFEESDSEALVDSDSDRSVRGWQEKASEGTPSKRQKLDVNIAEQEARFPSTSETVLTGTEGLADDEERSSGDFQGPAVDPDEADVIRALGPSNVQKLASLQVGDLQGFDEDSEEEDPFDDASDLESEDPITCVNCTQTLDSADTVCPECGHYTADDELLFKAERIQAASPSGHPNGCATILAYDDRLTQHEDSSQKEVHPERPDRIKAVIARLMTTGLADRCLRIPCRAATREELVECHTEHLVTKVEAVAAAASFASQAGNGDQAYMTSDTYVRPSTFRCASLAAGGCIEVATAIARGEVSNGAAVVRPPGHHAESGMAMGFCFFNNAAVAARAAQRAGARKVLILDWDIHHGNGTQHIFETDPSVLYMSIHRWDGGFFFPGTGGPHETGRGAGEGFTVNVPWACGGMGNGDYLAAFQHLILPIAYEFAPDLIIVSAGYDAAEGDPLGGCKVTPEGYAHMTAMLANVAPLAVLLEGGYNLMSTALGTEATLRVLLGERPPPLPNAGIVDPAAAMAIQTAVNRQSKYWRCLKPFVDHLSFDPYTSPFMDVGGSPRGPLRPAASGEASSPRTAAASQSQLLVPKGSLSLQSRPQDVARAIRSKFASRHQGKSQRRLQYMHALHLVALKHKIRAASMVTRKLRSRSNMQRLASDAHTRPLQRHTNPLRPHPDFQ